MPKLKYKEKKVRFNGWVEKDVMDDLLAFSEKVGKKISRIMEFALTEYRDKIMSPKNIKPKA